MNNIEPGCMCLIVKSRAGNEGLVVIALEFVGSIYDKSGQKYEGDDYWEIDKSIPCNRGTDYSNYCSESCLMRLDDYDESKCETVQEILEI